MTRRATTDSDHYWKVRVVLPNAVLHLACDTEPVITWTDPLTEEQIENVDAKWIDDPDKGDTFGFIHWPAVTGITWRWSGKSSAIGTSDGPCFCGSGKKNKYCCG